MYKMKNQEKLKSAWISPDEISYALSEPDPSKIPSAQPKNISKLESVDLLKNDPRGALFMVSWVIHEGGIKV